MKIEIQKQKMITEVVETPDEFDSVIKYNKNAVRRRHICRSGACRASNPWSLRLVDKPEQFIVKTVDSVPAREDQTIGLLAMTYPDHKISCDYDGNCYLCLEMKTPNPKYKQQVAEYNNWIDLAKGAYLWMKENNITPAVPKNRLDEILECGHLEIEND